MIFFVASLLISAVFLGVPSFVWWLDLIKRKDNYDSSANN